MSFFNKKEDILEVKLTPYGRKLLSHGQLKPEYYAFFDDDVLYDSNKVSQNGGTDEDSSQTKTRILTNTPSIKPLCANFGVESNNHTSDTAKLINNYMPYPIGTNSVVEKKSSGWDVISLDKEFDSFSLTSSLSYSNTAIKTSSERLLIPQINCKLEFTMSVGTPDPSATANALYLIQDESVFDQTIVVNDEQMVLYLMEKNGFLHGDSYEVEVFLREEQEENYTKLNFAKRPDVVVNGLLQHGETLDVPITPENVEYWIDLLLDEEVPDEDICKGLDKLKETSIYDELELICPERDEENIDIYVTTMGDVEECD